MSSHPSPVALITGSATGVGRACAIRFAELGYDIVVNYSRSEDDARETVRLVEEQGRTALLQQCDVRSDEQVQAMLAAVGERFGRLDVLVNNAAMTHFVKHDDLEGMTERKWDEILATNVKGAFFVTRAAVPLLKAAESAAIVNISSVAGLTGQGSSIAYCASKAALNSMTKSFARVLAPTIRVNAVCPGPIDTRWLRCVMSPDELQARAADCLIPRPARPDDVADTVLYLATGTHLTTGQCLTIDGGRTI
jgi:3-oxoacyl-[acyl-carrier protein] reductase